MSIKHNLLQLTRAMGANALLLRSRWRRQRLLILCYHGVSLGDEHLADPALYVSAAFFRRRLERLRRGGFTVLPLGGALIRLREGTLPPRSVVLTFDDGTRDFSEVVVPMLREFAMPATVYVATYYCDHPWPVFDTALRWVLWRGASNGAVLEGIVSGRTLSLRSETEQRAAWTAIYEDARERGYSAAQKHDLLRLVAAAVRVDFDAFLATGMYQQMTPAQLRGLPPDLVDVELHTHRHRTPRVRALFEREIVDNRSYLVRNVEQSAFTHFCYPSGDYWGEFVGWLRGLGVVSATTCVPGLAARDDNPMLLPRFLDSTLITDAMFDGWTSGVAALMPQRAQYQFEAERLAGVEEPAQADVLTTSA